MSLRRAEDGGRTSDGIQEVKCPNTHNRAVNLQLARCSWNRGKSSHQSGVTLGHRTAAAQGAGIGTTQAPSAQQRFREVSGVQKTDPDADCTHTFDPNFSWCQSLARAVYS
jgi:hypothetical protein